MDNVWPGARILLVEDEPIIALEIECVLTDLGAHVIGPAYTLPQAQTLADTDGLSAAILDIRLGQDEVWPVATRLGARGVPMLFHTGNVQPHKLKLSWPKCEVVVKPAPMNKLTDALASLLRAQS